jgi:hypothetical protein
MEKNNGKLGFVGQGRRPWTPLKPFLKEGFKNPKNFQKMLYDDVFLKFLEIPKNLFSKRFFGGGSEAATR